MECLLAGAGAGRTALLVKRDSPGIYLSQIFSQAAHDILDLAFGNFTIHVVQREKNDVVVFNILRGADLPTACYTIPPA